MSNYDLLKQKIQEAIPRLKDFTNGCIIETPHWNTFSQKFEDDNFDLFKCRFGKEPLLSDVLEWMKGLHTEIHSINKYGHFHDRVWNGIYSWDLSKPYLKEQNQELIDYLCTLG